MQHLGHTDPTAPRPEPQASIRAAAHLPDPRAAVQIQRTREMTIDELMLENRVIFLVGEINYAVHSDVAITPDPGEIVDGFARSVQMLVDLSS